MTDLAAFLLARYDEDERAARAATAGPWRYNPRKVWFKETDRLRAARAGIPMDGGEEFVGAGPDDGDNRTTLGVAATGPENNPQAMADARHIARWDPARVLAEVGARRQIIDLHRDPRFPSECPICDNLDGYGWHREIFPCPTLRLLALPYIDHPDYQEQWKP